MRNSVIPKILFLVEQVRPRATQVNNLGTPIPIFLQSCTFEAVECVRNSLTTTYYTFVLVVAERAFVTDPDQCCRPDVGVAHRAFAVALVAKPADRNAGLFSAHDQVTDSVSIAFLPIYCGPPGPPPLFNELLPALKISSTLNRFPAMTAHE